MRNKMRKYICIIGIFILNLRLYNITYASVNDESGIGVEITSSEDNQSIEINLKNTQVAMTIKRENNDKVLVCIIIGAFTGRHIDKDGTIKNADNVTNDEAMAYSDHRVHSYNGELSKENDNTWAGKLGSGFIDDLNNPSGNIHQSGNSECKIQYNNGKFLVWISDKSKPYSLEKQGPTLKIYDYFIMHA